MTKLKNVISSIPASVNIEIRKPYITPLKLMDYEMLYRGFCGDLNESEFDFEKYSELYVTLFPKIETPLNVRLVISLWD